MAKLYLTFEGRPLKEFTLSHGVVTIGRLPDNLVQIDNLAVSGHHARVYWDADHYVIEDNNSLNGTYVNTQRVGKIELQDGDKILIGKHTLEFSDEWHEDGQPAEEATQAVPPVPAVHATMVLDTKKAKEMMAQAKASQAALAQTEAAAAAAASAGAAPGAPAGPTGTMMTAVPPVLDRPAMLTILEGKTDEREYVLSGRLTAIGKSEMATVKLKGWFAPNLAASITKRDGKYFIAAQDKGAKVRVNGADIIGQKELVEGDTLEVAGVKMAFGYSE